MQKQKYNHGVGLMNKHGQNRLLRMNPTNHKFFEPNHDKQRMELSYFTSHYIVNLIAGYLEIRKTHPKDAEPLQERRASFFTMAGKFIHDAVVTDLEQLQGPQSPNGDQRHRALFDIPSPNGNHQPLSVPINDIYTIRLEPVAAELPVQTRAYRLPRVQVNV